MVDTSKKVTVNQFVPTNSNKNFALCTNVGFRVHCMFTAALKMDCQDILGGTKLCQTYGNSSLVFFVGNGFDPRFPSTKVVLWDQAKREAIAEIDFRTQVINLIVTGDWIIVAEQTQVHVFNFEAGCEEVRFGV